MVSDITYLPLASGNWVYCCAFQDVCTKQVVGWQVRADMSEALVTTALQRALLAQQPALGLIVHSDRGGQYVGKAYKTLLRDAKAQLSHSRRGECYDNAQAESLWSRLKTELLELRDWPVSPTWPMRKPASPTILTTTTTTAATPSLAI